MRDTLATGCDWVWAVSIFPMIGCSGRFEKATFTA